jgi:hypothetical protein
MSIFFQNITLLWDFPDLDNLIVGLETIGLLILVVVFLPQTSDNMQESKRIKGIETNK